MRTIRFVLISIVLLGLLVSCSSPETRDTPSSETSLEEATPQELTVSPTAPLEIDLSFSELPPGVIERSPLAGQRMALDASIQLVFSQAMDTALTAGGWQFTDMDGTVVDGELAWPDERSLTFQPTRPLEPGAIYLATLENATTADGIALEETVALEFLTVDALQVSQVFPEDATSEIAVNTPITTIFNRPVVPLTIFEEQSTLPQPLSFEPEIQGTGEWINTSVYVFTPDDLLQSDTLYEVAINADLTGVDGVSLGEDYGWEFSTVTPSIQNFGIVDGASNPSNYHRNVIRDASFWISFRQPMDRVSFQETFTLMNLDSGQTLAVDLEWNEAFTSVEIIPRRRLDIDSEYRLRLLATAEATTGGTLRSGIDWIFTTLPLPGIESISPADGSVQEYFFSDISVDFRSPMNPATFEGRIQLSPAPEGELDWFYYPYGWSLNIFGLQPSTEYELRLLPGMADIYGNRIQDETVITFTTAARSPYAYLNMPYTTTIYRDGSELAFYTDYSNVSEIEYALYHIDPGTYAGFLRGVIGRNEYRPAADDLIRRWTTDSEVELNIRAREKQLLTTSDGDPLQPGYYFLGLNAPELDSPTPFEDARIFVVASANLTLKATTTEALAWVTDLDTGEPLEGVRVRVYSQNFKQLAIGKTDGDGLFYATDINEGQFALIDDDEALGFASINWGNGVRLGDFGVSTNYYSPPNTASVYLYTDRPLYRPGQTVSFKGILRLNDDLEYSIPEDEQVLVKIEAFDEVIYEKTLRLSDFGSFDSALLLDQDAQLGSYQIRVYYPDEDEQAGSLSFSVGEYRKPEFQLNIQAQEAAVLDGEDFTVDIGAEYFSGGGVADAAVQWTLQSTPYTFQPGGDYRRFSFGDLERDSGYYYFSPGYTESIAEGAAITDADGQVQITLDAELAESGQARQLALLANVTDVAGNLVGGRTGLVVHSSRLYAGVRPLNYVGGAGEEQSFQMVVLDWDAQPVPEQRIDIEIVERRWYSVQELDEQGQLRWVTSVEEIPVISQNGLVTDSDGLAQVDFVPPNGGVYKATVITRDEAGNQARASAFLWVSGSAYVSWRQNNDRSFELVADKDQYSPGDTAEILIASPFEENVYALITVERGRIRSQEVLELTSNSTVYQLPIDAGMAPNIYVSVVVVRGLDDVTERPDFKMSVIELNVDTSEQELLVEITPDQEEAGPGDEVSYTVRTTDKSGDPVQAEVSLALADLAALSLSAPNSAPLLSHFYSTRSLGVRTAVPILLDAALFNEEFEGTEGDGTSAGSGGGKGSGLAGVIEIREDFPDTALWEAQVLTDADGEATISVTLPDNLTTWRMDARAFTLEMRVGQNTQDLISSKPLLVRPQTPRFFVTGDEAQVGTAINNNTEEELDVTVGIDAEGLDVAGPLTRSVTIPAGRQAYVYWDVSVRSNAQRVDLVFSASGGNYQDASRPTLGSLDGQGIPVFAFEAPETVGTAGVLYEGDTRTEAIALPSIFEVGEGALTIELAPSLAASMTEGLDYLKHYPYECMEQTVSRFLPNVITSQALEAAGISDAELQADLDAQVNVALQRIYGHQNADGGWGWWSGQESQLQTSAYVVLGLIEAQEAGYPVDEDVAANGIDYLDKQVKFVNTLDRPYLYNQQAFLLYVLSRSGSARVGHSVQLFSQREALSLYGRAYLAQALYIINPQDDRLNDLVSDLAGAAILSAAGAHWQEEWRDYWNWNTDTRTTAIILDALVQIDPDNELNPAAVRWLMHHRESGHWRSTQETAWTLMALTGWMAHAREFESQYQYLVALNEEVIGEGVASTENLTDTLQLQIDVADLLKAEANRLTFARDDGTGNLYYTTYLSVNLPVEDIEPLDQGIVLSRSYYALEDPETPLTEVQQGDLVRARLTIVIPNDLHYIVIDDPLPAGLEAVDRSLLTSVQTPETYSWSNWREIGWGWWYFDHVELRDEKLVLSADYLPAGTYTYTYIARAGLPGAYRVIPPTAQEFYFPDVYGRGAGSLFTVLP